MVFGIMRGLRIFEVEIDRRLEEAERARLRAAERARGAMEAMAAIISEHRELARLLDAALGQMLGLVGSAGGWVALHDANSQEVEIHAIRGLPPAPKLAGRCAQVEQCACRLALERRDATVLPSGDRCGLWATAPGTTLTIVPLLAQDRQVGVVHLLEGDFTPESMALLTSLGKQLGLAVENVKLALEVGRKEAARAQLLRKVITAQEEERRRVAVELHDQTGQSLTAVIMALGAAGAQRVRGSSRLFSILGDARDIAVQALEGTRALIMDLRPPVLDDLGLVPALRRLAKDLSSRGDTEIAVETNGLAGRLRGDVEVALFRILQESLHNVVRHSRAHRATLHLSTNDREVRAVVTDDGAGFDLADALARPESGRGLGLLGMKERAALLGGEVVVETARGQGTRVLVRIPFEEDGDHGIPKGVDRR